MFRRFGDAQAIENYDANVLLDQPLPRPIMAITTSKANVPGCSVILLVGEHDVVVLSLPHALVGALQASREIAVEACDTGPVQIQLAHDLHVLLFLVDLP